MLPPSSKLFVNLAKPSFIYAAQRKTESQRFLAHPLVWTDGPCRLVSTADDLAAVIDLGPM